VDVAEIVLVRPRETAHLVGAGIGARDRSGGREMQKINRLTARSVATLDRPGRHSDGAGLYLSISNEGSARRRRWVLLFRWNGKLKEMGLGSASTVTLAQARLSASK
jgi:hypothetical protein